MQPFSNVKVLDLGIPVRSVNWAGLHAGINKAGRPCIYAAMGQQGDNLFVLQIDPETGAFRQFLSGVPESNYPTAGLMSRSGKFYVGASYAGHLLCFDPEKDGLADLGAIHPGAATFPCRIDEDSKGILWIGSYGTADLTSYNPSSGEFKRYGRMDETDMYNYPFVNGDDSVACLIRMVKPHVVVFDPRSGSKEVVGPVTTKGEHTLSLGRAGDGALYIESSLGNFRVEASQAIPVSKLPPPQPAPTLADGSSFSFEDSAEQICRKVKVQKPDGTVRTFEIAYEAAGSDLFYIHAGPDGCIYGSSIMPLHLFRYRPNKGELADLGKCSSAGGEAYSMANLDGRIYISSYPAAVLSVYDPGLAYHFGTGTDDNPRDLGRVDDISYRPRSTLAGPLGRVWVASVPDYGMWGGPLSWYDPATGQRKAYYRICGDASCYTLAWLKELSLLAVGTTIQGGSGTQPKVDQATLFLWDYEAEKKVWEGTLDRPVSSFNALVAGGDGRLYGTVRGKDVPNEIFALDPEAREFLRRAPLPEGAPLDLGLQNGPDGNIYGFTSSCIYRFHPSRWAIEPVVREQHGFTVAGPILDKEVYFGTKHRLRSAQIF